MTRPPFLIDTATIPEQDEPYPGDDERMAFGRAIGKAAGLQKLGLHLVRVPPGRRTSYPHAEGDEEEFVYVLDGEIDAWIDGTLHRMRAGDLAGFPSGTGIAHAFLNNGNREALLLVGGERSTPGHRIYYPLHPGREQDLGEEWWADAPRHPQGDHDGRAGCRLGARARAWAEELIAEGVPIDLRKVESWCFGGDAELSDDLLAQVIRGTKNATTGSTWWMDHERLPYPMVGGHSIVTTHAGEPRVLLETTRVEILRFGDVGAEFAGVEGEGDGSLDYWRRVHIAYFTEECASIGRTFTEDMPVVCERYKVVRVRDAG